MRSLQEAIGYRFSRPELLKAALTHKSFAPDRRGEHFNERLEFLGDSILSGAVAHRLFERFPEDAEGSLSKRKAALVSKGSLAAWAQELGLGEHLRLGPSEESAGGRLRPSILADALEALIGAMYLDGGYDAAKGFIDSWIDGQTRIEQADHKSRLQEIVQKRYKSPPTYELIEAAGPEHDKTFRVRVRLGRHELGSGSGKTKKDAEQDAAKDALEQGRVEGVKRHGLRAD